LIFAIARLRKKSCQRLYRPFHSHVTQACRKDTLKRAESDLYRDRDLAHSEASRLAALPLKAAQAKLLAAEVAAYDALRKAMAASRAFLVEFSRLGFDDGYLIAPTFQGLPIPHIGDNDAPADRIRTRMEIFIDEHGK